MRLLLLSLLCALPLLTALNTRPIVGILTLAVVDDVQVDTGYLGSDYIPRSKLPSDAHAYLPASYVKWLEQAGARVVPIPYDAQQNELDNYMKSINGLLFTGGSLSLAPNTTYFETAHYLYNSALNLNDAGVHFPIWGTCQGMQLLSILAAGFHGVLKCGIYDSENLALPLQAIAADTVSTSYLLGGTKSATLITQSSTPPPLHGTYNTTTVYDILFNTPSTQNLHQCGVNPTDFMLSPGLHRMFQILTINQDRKNQPFVSTMQALNYPFFATQWHPERPQYEWDTQESSMSHDSLTLSAMSHIATRFVDRCRYNDQHFISSSAEEAALIYQYPVTYTGNDTNESYPDRQIYYFTNSLLI